MTILISLTKSDSPKSSTVISEKKDAFLQTVSSGWKSRLFGVSAIAAGISLFIIAMKLIGQNERSQFSAQTMVHEANSSLLVEDDPEHWMESLNPWIETLTSRLGTRNISWKSEQPGDDSPQYIVLITCLAVTILRNCANSLRYCRKIYF